MNENNTLTSLIQRAGPQVTQAIRAASTRTGVNFSYLMEKAAAESSFDADAKARTSSATGLFQFIESTWLNMVKKHGHKYGMGALADQIDQRGRVQDRTLRAEILELRKDPEKASLLAAEFAAENKRHLQRHYGGDIGATELYFAHFLGAGGATAFLNAHRDNPLGAAADLFPEAARANRNVFYDRQTGQPRTMAGIYEFFDKKFKAGDSPAMAGHDAPTMPPVPKAKAALPAQNATESGAIAGNWKTGFTSYKGFLRSPAAHDPAILNFLTSPFMQNTGHNGFQGWLFSDLSTHPGMMARQSDLYILAQTMR